MNRPLLAPTLVMAAGIVAGWEYTSPPGILIVAGFAGAWAGLRNLRPRPVWLLLFCFLFGVANISWHSQPAAPNDLRVLLDDQPVLARLTGTLTGNPLVRVNDFDDGGKARSRVTLQVHSLQINATSRPATGRVTVTTPGEPHPDWSSGTRVEIFGVLQPPPTAAAPGLFDYREKLRRQNIHFELATGGTNDWRVLSRPAPPPLHSRFQALARRQLALGLPGEDDSLRLLWAMTLGWRTGLTDELAEPFMRSGTMHVFAISGLHIALIAGILIALLRVLRLPRRYCGILVIPALWFYCAATGWQSSAVRATLMMSIIVGGWAWKRPGDLLNSICAAALLILVWEPGQLLQASFQLSFAVVTTLALLLPRFDQLRQRLLQPDPFLPEDLVPWWRRQCRTAVKFVFNSVCVSLAAWLGSLPLIAHYFHLFTPGSLLANPPVVISAALALMSALGGFLTSALPLPVAGWFNHSAWFWITCQSWVSEQVAAFPHTWWQVRSPWPWEFLFYYGALIVIATPACWRPSLRRWSIGALALGGTTWIATLAWPPSTVSITVLGRGANAIHIDAPGTGDDLLLDCGRTPAFRFVTRPFLQSHGLNHLEQLALSHGDIAHVQAFDEVWREWKPRQVITSAVSQRSAPYRAVLEKLGGAPEVWREVDVGDQFGNWRVLHPPATGRFDRADDAALVLVGEWHGTRVMLAPDLGREGQATLLDSGQDLRADVLISGLPAGGEPLGNGFITAVQPRLIILHDNWRPATDRAGRALKQRLAQAGIPVLHGSTAGTISLELDASGFRVRPMTQGPLDFEPSIRPR